MAKEPKNGAGKQPDDSNATTETMAFIKGLHAKYDAAKLRLAQLTANLDNLQLQQKNIGEEYTRIRTDEKIAKSHLEEAESALASVFQVLDFFRTRKKTTAALVQHSYNAAHAMFVSLYQLKEQGLDRVEAIKDIVVGKDPASGASGDSTDASGAGTTPTLHWTQILTRHVLQAEAQGVAAFNAGAKAVQDAFNAYVSNQEIHARTLNYYTRFAKLEGEFRDVIHFKQTELSLIRKKFIILDGKNQVIEKQVNDLAEKVAMQNFTVAQLQAEYNAAQQGAEYQYVAPSGATA